MMSPYIFIFFLGFISRFPTPCSTAGCRNIPARGIRECQCNTGETPSTDHNYWSDSNKCSTGASHVIPSSGYYPTWYCCCNENRQKRSVATYSFYGHQPQGLQLTQHTLAVEGRSFCIVGEHIKATELAEWDVLSGFRDLLKFNLDIGNHIHPEDYTKMNRLERNGQEYSCERDELSFKNRPALHADQPDAKCYNPYKVEVTEIHSHRTRLHNYLHIRVYADSRSQPSGAVNCPTGKMRYLMLEVRDSVGLPVGHFTDEVPCDKDVDRPVPAGPKGIKGKRLIGGRENIMPCMYSPKKAVSHPGIFLASAVKSSSSGAGPAGGGGGGGGSSGPNATDNYFTEVHATWRFAQHTSNFITQLHFGALIVEDTKDIRYFTGRKHAWQSYATCLQGDERCGIWNASTGECKHTYHYYSWVRGYYAKTYYSCHGSHTENTRPYGYIAQYSMLRPTKFTLGGWDLYRKQFSLPKYVNCHEQISKTHYAQDSGGSILPTWMAMLHPSTTERDAYIQTTMSFLGVSNSDENVENYIFRHAQKDKKKLYTLYSAIDDTQPATTYFGTKYTSRAYTNYETTVPVPIREWLNSLNRSVSDMGRGERCPCPALPSTIPPEEKTKKPLELDGRRLHAVNMLIAWVILMPISMFSARYFKETYSRVYFMREFWWYTVHVLTVITALLFMLGGVFIIRMNRVVSVPWTNEIWLHATFGYCIMVTFAFHMVFGSFRFMNVYYRIMQIMMHWLFGMLEYMFAVGAIMVCAAIRQGFMNCDTFNIYCGFLAVQVLFHVGMDVHLRIVDNILGLKPPRSYLPPPVMRLFHMDAPYGKFRVVMLIIFCLTCCGFYAAMHYSLAREGLETSCYEPLIERNDTIEV